MNPLDTLTHVVFVFRFDDDIRNFPDGISILPHDYHPPHDHSKKKGKRILKNRKRASVSGIPRSLFNYNFFLFTATAQEKINNSSGSVEVRFELISLDLLREHNNGKHHEFLNGTSTACTLLKDLTSDFFWNVSFYRLPSKVDFIPGQESIWLIELSNPSESFQQEPESTVSIRNGILIPT